MFGHLFKDYSAERTALIRRDFADIPIVGISVANCIGNRMDESVILGKTILTTVLIVLGFVACDFSVAMQFFSKTVLSSM